MLKTDYRTIVSEIPHPDSLPLLETLANTESRSTHGQPPVVWDKATGFQVYDPYGNKFIDFTSGVMVANSGHSDPEVLEAISKQVENQLLYSYCFPSQPRADLLQELVSIAPEGLKRVYLLSTGAEAIETTLKLSLTHAKSISSDKNVIVSFQNAFHGRSMGAQLAGGIPGLKNWLQSDLCFVQVPFPDGIYGKDLSFDSFTHTLEQLQVKPEQVAAVLMETYQGGVVQFAPTDYVKQLREWCNDQDALLIFDEVQAGFGRTGLWWGFEHYGVNPDLFACGKGISGGLPVSAVFGRDDLMQQYGPGSMTTTHGANTLCCASAAANIKVLKHKQLVSAAQELEGDLLAALEQIKTANPDLVAHVCGKGLVGGIHLKDCEGGVAQKIAANVVNRAVAKGLMLFAPVGPEGATIKICPPLCISKEALREGMGVIAESLSEEQN